MKKTIKILEKGRVKEKEITYIPVRFIIAILLIFVAPNLLVNILLRAIG